jgi:hypothetical protein
MTFVLFVAVAGGAAVLWTSWRRLFGERDTGSDR